MTANCLVLCSFVFSPACTSLVISTTAIDCLNSLVSKMTRYVSNGNDTTGPGG